MEKYSVLMAVYHKDRPDWLIRAADSMLSQTLPPSEFVLVEDGPVGDDIARAAAEILERASAIGCGFRLVKLDKNAGLGPALNEGLRHCSNSLVARMDSDDISLPGRCLSEAAFMEQNPGTDVLSGTILEFEGSDADAFAKFQKGLYDGLRKKEVPATDDLIRASAAMRNPMNHPAVMFRKEAVQKAGGYRSVPFFEDYDLWLRMLCDKDVRFGFANLEEPLLLMRADGMYERRGGIRYAGCVLAFRRSMYMRGIISLPRHILTTAARVAVSLLPSTARRFVYTSFLR